MKKNHFLLLTLLLFCSFFAFSQKNLKIPQKIISFKQSRFSLGVGLEAGLMLNASKPSGLDVIYKDPRKTDNNNVPYTAYGLVFDVYSANSIIGILGGLDYSTSKFGLQKDGSTTDYFDISKVEIPLYLKFRFGSVTSTKHLWLLLGGVYNIPQNCKREQFDAIQGSSAYATLTDDNKQQLTNYFALSGSVGYEFFLGDTKHFRAALYSRIVYPISNELNSKYSEFISGGNSVLQNYSNFDIREYRITFGIKFMFQFGEALSIMADAATKSLK